MVAWDEKLKNLGQETDKSNLPGAIFGSASTMSRETRRESRYRIGLWPCIGNEVSFELAMGIQTIFALLLDQLDDCFVHRLFLRITQDTEEIFIDEPTTQFTVDDYILDNLHENVAVWSTLTSTISNDETRFDFRIFLENDLDGAEHVDQIECSGTSLTEIFGQLPDMVIQVAEKLKLDKPLLPNFQNHSEMNEDLISSAFDWECELLISLWLDEPDMQVLSETYQELLLQGGQNDAEAFVVCASVVRGLLPGFGVVRDILLSGAKNIANRIFGNPWGLPFLARQVHRVGRSALANELLEAEIEINAASAMTYQVMAEMYWDIHNIDDAIDTIQEAIEVSKTSEKLYGLYAEIIMVMIQQDIPLPAVILVDEEPEDTVSYREAISALELSAINVESAEMLRSLVNQIQLMADSKDERIWERFSVLISQDEEGGLVREAIETLLNVEDIQPLKELLQDYADKYPDKSVARINLAVVFMLAEEYEQAEDILRNLYDGLSETARKAEIERLLLNCTHPNFESRYYNMIVSLNAGTRPSSSDLAFLEKIVEEAPSFTEGYILLASAHRILEELDIATELLLDAHERFPENVAIINALAAILFASEEDELAMSYVDKGLEINQQSVPLLVKAGRYHFDNDNIDEARLFIAQAEKVDPRDPELAALRRYIGSQY